MGWTPLHTAARDGDAKRLKRCIEQIKWLDPVDINAQSSQGHTPLHMCAANGHVEVMQYILAQKDCDKNAQTKLGNTALHLAALNSREPACKMLVSHGADAKRKNQAGQTAADLCPAENKTLRQFLVEQSTAEKPEDMEEDEEGEV
ncbi:hypothetical protein GUITHDRAFT_153844 [Guillardia theta CCMP2712]|uniref:Uncharacterized protein n=1 Tax=Guillardia theta (strain CCMP2712) TaxID=905079 RepID=L1IZV1_GUITC|nr:hypothetical protein GUITHDRAFT_153844 [Guillardia theta CCMP2712]EKX41345.1 hypothetical protein GUITHDRAFT_153844 [Guillardia theta CCMP2712]|eukprot:XP_005828325.1 hypothetical protein GUITHDRAFT_153844 [Guillardia theta CCMP2712]